jgi:hypothetical protein
VGGCRGSPTTVASTPTPTPTPRSSPRPPDQPARFSIGLRLLPGGDRITLMRELTAFVAAVEIYRRLIDEILRPRSPIAVLAR